MVDLLFLRRVTLLLQHELDEVVRAIFPDRVLEQRPDILPRLCRVRLWLIPVRGMP
jgi:hypothetical protein